MKTAQIQQLLMKKPSPTDSAEILEKHGEDLIVQILRKPESSESLERMLSSLQLVTFISQYQTCCEQISRSPEFDNLIRTCLHSSVRMKTSKLFHLYIAILTNMCIQDEICERVSKCILPQEVVVIYSELISTNNTNALYFLENVSRSMIPTTPLLQAIVVHLQKRGPVSTQISKIIRNLFIHLRDEHDIIQVYTPLVKDLILECTGEEFKEQFLNGLKIFETEHKEVFNEQKMHADITIFNLIEALILYVRLDKSEVKKLYPQLRELHMYMIKKAGDNFENELNDAINVLIEHCISDDVEEPRKEEEPAADGEIETRLDAVE
ncbi:Conserved_hypothetical protein [Hexamita inflata]|uniref:Uncharacterized protein n=1 Tax=Hexamita inflata TaxID=28002 RepID=A0AA86TSX7_9EUKA|nr:Conserved hypothetical protein [Hexamita inflata]